MDYLVHLSKDKKLAKALIGQKPFKLKIRKNVPLRLCASIMSQQLSVKVAEVLFRRFLELYNGEEPTSQQIVDTPFEKLRSIGLSNAKVSYVHNVVRFTMEHKIDDKKLKKMSDEDIIELLMQIKGVGKWTIEMLLMFTLGRPDIFAIDDYGIQSAMKKLYGLEDNNKKEFREKLLKISGKWTPYRTYACLHLWSWKDNKPLDGK